MLQRLLPAQLLVLERRISDVEDIKGYMFPEEILRERRRILTEDNWNYYF